MSPVAPALQVDSLPLSHQGSPINWRQRQTGASLRNPRPGQVMITLRSTRKHIWGTRNVPEEVCGSWNMYYGTCVSERAIPQKAHCVPHTGKFHSLLRGTRMCSCHTWNENAFSVSNNLLWRDCFLLKNLEVAEQPVFKVFLILL